ncbi:MAG: hypothetical protein AAF682_04555 [Planctomycetota bacterium]
MSNKRSKLCRALSAAIPVPGAALLLVGVAAAQTGLAFDPAAAIVERADANRDGDVAAEEWAGFLGDLGGDLEGNLDRDKVLGRLFYADLDGDGAMTRDDVVRLVSGERAGSARTASPGNWMLPALADTDANGEVTDGELLAFLTEYCDVEGEVTDELLIGWVQRIQAMPPPEDRGAITPPVALASFGPVLDSDRNGRLTLDDLNALHRTLDANGDGKVEAAELTAPPSPAATRRTDWRVSSADRERVPLMPWQRTLEDALQLVEATGKPLLICVNMDGEAASESLAFGRYRDPAFVELASGFVPVVASPDRREPRERDDRGRRLHDRRFGRLLNSEHIDIEPLLYEAYFNGNRVAPRHVGVSPTGEILFDLYLLQDLSIIDGKLREFGVPSPPSPAPSSLSEAELLASPDAANRAELERRFVEAGEDARAMLAGLALSAERATQHPELIRLALRDSSEKVRRAAARAVALHSEAAPADEAIRAYGAAGEAGVRGKLAASFGSLATLAALDAPSAHVDPARWKLLLAGAPTPPAETVTLEAFEATVERLDALDAALREAPDDGELLVRRAEEVARMARIQLGLGGNPTFFLQDAVAACDDALTHVPDDARALGLRAWSIYMQGDIDPAADAAVAAVRALERDSGSALAADVLGVLANARTRQIYGAGGNPDPAWVSDAHAAFEALLAHPASTEAHRTTYLDLLGSLSAFHLQGSALRDGLARDPLSERLHGYLRFQVLRDRGARALEAAYEAEPLASAPDWARPTLDWYHGLATLIAAEQDVQNRDAEAARAAYARSGLLFARSAEAEPGFASSSAHYQCLVLTGLSRLQAEDGRWLDAVRSLTEAFSIAPGSVEQLDGLGKTPAATARELRSSLRGAGKDDLVGTLEAGLAEAGFGFRSEEG